MFRIPVLLLLSAAALANETEVRVEADGDAVVVSSPMKAGNFLFRAPAGFRRGPTPEGQLVQLEQGDKDSGARIRVALTQISEADTMRGALQLGAARRAWALGADSAEEPSWEGDRARGLATANVVVEGRDALRYLLHVADGDRLYLLTLDAWPRDSDIVPKLRETADGFTLLNERGIPEAPLEAGDVKASTITHSYYRLAVFRPYGFARQRVDPLADKGIFLHLQRVDQRNNRCDIRIRVHLKKTVKRKIVVIAQSRIDAFVKKHPGAKVSKKPKRTRWPAADEAYKFVLAGKTKGYTLSEDWRVLEHENDRVYEIQVTTYGGAAREWRKDIAAFWKKIKITK